MVHCDSIRQAKTAILTFSNSLSWLELDEDMIEAEFKAGGCWGRFVIRYANYIHNLAFQHWCMIWL